MIQVNEIHNKIISTLQKRGPSLPIHLTKELNISTLFVSAFLAELVENRKIRISNLKVGGSPLYFLEGQESKLENFYNYLHPKESEVFLLLKNNKVLKDIEQDPVVRVALRSIKDFAFSFNFEGEIYWRCFLISENEAREKILSERKIIEKKIYEKEVKEEKTEGKEGKSIKVEVKIKKKTSEKDKVETKEKLEFENPLIIKEKVKPKKEKPKSSFVLKVIDFLQKNNLKIIKEVEHKSKEYRCIIEASSQLGNIRFFTEAKDKKTISESDFKKLLSDSQKIPLPAFLLYTGEISKKAKQYLIDYSSILKAKKIE